MRDGAQVQELKELISSYQGLRESGRGAAICSTIIETARQCNLDKDVVLPEDPDTMDMSTEERDTIIGRVYSKCVLPPLSSPAVPRGSTHLLSCRAPGSGLCKFEPSVLPGPLREILFLALYFYFSFFSPFLLSLCLRLSILKTSYYIFNNLHKCNGCNF